MSSTCTLSDFTSTSFLGGLGTLRALLDAADKHAEGESIPVTDLLGARLRDDMFDFKQQVQAATDSARRITDRLSGAEASSRPDPEPTVAALLARIDETIEHVKSADASKIDENADVELSVDLGAGPMTFTGRSLALGFAVPNVLFHVTTAYDILRHRGVSLGKVMYVMPFMSACARG
ncbi:MAG: DUF1993 domain-containing protein [Myxococcales bacterium]|jgi:hypothetical protein